MITSTQNVVLIFGRSGTIVVELAREISGQFEMLPNAKKERQVVLEAAAAAVYQQQQSGSSKHQQYTCLPGLETA